MSTSLNKVLTFKEGCAYTGYKESYMHKLTSSGIVPYSQPNGKKIFFEREKLEAWMLGNPSTSLQDKQIQAATYVSTKK